MKFLPTLLSTFALALLTAASLVPESASAQIGGLPVVSDVGYKTDGKLEVQAIVPRGNSFALLEALEPGETSDWVPLIAGAIDPRLALVTFSLKDPQNFLMMRVRVGAGVAGEVPFARETGGEVMDIEYLPDGGGGSTLTPMQQAGHVLNRLGYGVSAQDLGYVLNIGAPAYIQEQLAPADPDETSNVILQEKLSPLYYDYLPGTGTQIVGTGDTWKFFRGTSEPASEWNAPEFDDSAWEEGVSGIGYGDDDDATELGDMRRQDGNNGYLSLYVRKAFELEDIGSIENLILAGRYDDGFVAYLNGTEIARENVTGNPPRYNSTANESAGNVDNDDVPDSFGASQYLSLLNEGENVLAIQMHNASYTSSDLTMDLALVSAPPTPFDAIRGLRELQELIHLRGIYSQNQLQAVLGEFWENHFTTDYNKLVDFVRDIDEYDDIRDISDADRSRIYDQIDIEAARMEWQEYEFFHKNALGNFSDLLLYSATSPSMLIYLDNVLNLAEEPNENYAREILELYAFGVDNRYTQTDIEQMAKCFTGWSIKKVNPAFAKSFPDSARNPETTASIAIASEEEIVGLGAGWRYFKGREEPAATAEGNPTTAWAMPDFNDADWAAGSTGIGYADGDDATQLNDMRNNYTSVYLRREFANPGDLTNVVLDVGYDDGFVAYLNGTAVARFNMGDTGTPPAFDATADGSHEVDRGNAMIPLAPHADLMVPGTNILAIQVHNTSLSSSDLSMLPRIVKLNYQPESIEVTDPGGLWTFRFDPSEHDTSRKVLFEGTEYEIIVPEGRVGITGVNDAIQVIDAMVAHPSTSEFIVIKLINRFVSDEITLDSYHDGVAPEDLVKLANRGIAAWHATNPAGNIRNVLDSILDPREQSTPFWSEVHYLNKVKNPIEFINSAVRAVGADVVDDQLHRRNEDMGMMIFERDDPDGFSEYGYDWMDTQGLLERMKFSQALADDGNYSGTDWDFDTFLSSNQLESTENIIDYFNTTLFQGQMTEQRKAVFLNYADTTLSGSPSIADNLGRTTRLNRMRAMVALILSSPEFQYQ
jgi:hypothetical protein